MAAPRRGVFFFCERGRDKRTPSLFAALFNLPSVAPDKKCTTLAFHNEYSSRITYTTEMTAHMPA